MSYSVHEAIQDAKARVEWLEAVREFDPDVYLCDNEWHSKKLTLEDCTDVDVDDKGVLRFYKVLCGGRINIDILQRGARKLSVVLWAMRDDDRAAYDQLVALLRDSVRRL